ncbi:MAG: glycosyltransferase family 9 protein [Pseudomonadota bacterium]
MSNRVLIIQLERAGDTIQSTPLMFDVSEDSSTSVDLLTVTSSQEIIHGLSILNQTFSIAPQTLIDLENAMASTWRSGKDLPEAVRVLDSLNLPEYDLVINLTHSKFGCWLAGKIHATELEGGVITEQGEWLYQSDWHVYLLALMSNRQQNLFNLVDLYRASAKKPHPPSSNRHPYVTVAKDSGVSLPTGRKVALNPGASAEKRRWPRTSYANLANALHDRGLVPILLGSPADEQICEEVAAACKHKPPIYCHTSIPEMAKLLEEIDILVSNDTGAVHIASAVGTPIVGLYGTFSWYAETAPWGQGHLILQAPLSKEETPALEQITVEMVLFAVLERLKEVDLQSLQLTLANTTVAAWETFFLPESTDPLGGLAYLPLHGSNLTSEAVFSIALRHALAWGFCGGTAPKDTLAYLNEFVTSGKICLSINLMEEYTILTRSIGRLITLLGSMATGAAQAKDLCSHFGPNTSVSQIRQITLSLTTSLDEAKQAAEKIPVFAPLINHLDWKAKNMPLLEPIALFAEHEKQYRRGASILARAKQMVDCFLKSL